MTALPDFALAGPEILLAAGALVLLMLGAYGGERRAGLVSGLASLLLVVAAVAVMLGREGTTFDGAFVVDGFARFMKVSRRFCSASSFRVTVPGR